MGTSSFAMMSSGVHDHSNVVAVSYPQRKRYIPKSLFDYRNHVLESDEQLSSVPLCKECIPLTQIRVNIAI